MFHYDFCTRKEEFVESILEKLQALGAINVRRSAWGDWTRSNDKVFNITFDFKEHINNLKDWITKGIITAYWIWFEGKVIETERVENE